MADASQSTDDVGTNSQTTRNVLLKRNPHLRSSETSSPGGFGGLGTRQFLQKQLMTPGSATSASSFEEGASYDGFSDAGTPGMDFQTSFQVKTEPTETSHYVTRTVSKQPTKRLSSPSRESLARRLTTTESSNVEVMEGEILSNLVVKKVPNITRTVRRIVRRTGADGRVHEQVQIVDAEGNIVEELPSTIVTSSPTRVVTPAKLTKRTVRRTGADGQVHEQVQYLDVDGNVVRTEGDAISDSLSSSSSSSRTIVTPGKTIRRVIVRRTGADGQMHEEVQSMDADGNVVQGDWSDMSSFTNVSDVPLSSGGRTVVTRRVVSPGQALKRVMIRTKDADGEIREEVQYVDADGNVVSTGGGDLSKSGSFTTEETITHEGSSTPGRRKVTRRIVRRMIIRKDGTRVPVEQYVDSDGHVIESEDCTLARTDSFSSAGDNSSSRRTITRRVVTSPAKVVTRTVVHKAGSTSGSGAESEDEVQYVDAEGGDLTSSSRSITSQSTPGRRVITRRVVTPQRVVRRMVVRKGTTSTRSSTAVDVDDLDIDAEFVETEGASSDESVGGSSRGVSSRRSETRRVVSSTVTTSNQPQEEIEQEIESNTGGKKVVTSVSTSKHSEITTSTRAGIAVVSEPEEGSISTETTQKIGLTPIWDYFTKSEDEEKPAANLKVPNEAASTSSAASRTSTTTKTRNNSTVEPADDEEETPMVSGPVVAAGVAGSAIVASTIFHHKTSPDEEDTVTAPEEGVYFVSSVEEPSVVPSQSTARSDKDHAPAAGGFWNFFGKSEDNQVGAPSSDEESDKPKKPIEGQVVPRLEASLVTKPAIGDEVIHEADQPSDDDEFETPQTPLDVSEESDVVTTTSTSVELSPKDEDDSEITTGQLTIPVAAGTGVEAMANPERERAQQHPSEVDDGISEPVVIVFAATEEKNATSVKTNSSTSTTLESSKSPHHEGRSSGGFWGFFGKSEEESKETVVEHGDMLPATSPAQEPVTLVQKTKQQLPADEDANISEADMSATMELPTAEGGVASTAFVEKDVAEISSVGEEEDSKILPSNVLPTGADLVGDERTTQPDEITSDMLDRDADVVPATTAEVTSSVTLTTKTQEVEEESRGGFWGFFGKSEEKQHEVPASDNSDEDKAPIPVGEDVQDDDINAPEPKVAVESPQPTPKSQTENDVLRTVAFGGAAAAAVVSAIENEKPKTHPTAQSPKSEIVELVEEEVVVPVTVVSPNAAHSVVPAIQTTTTTTITTEEESESPSKGPQRKTGRSIWKFWGAETPNSSPTRTKTEKVEEQERGVDPVGVPHATTTVVSTEQTETPGIASDEARQYWHQQDQENPSQISDAASEGATYGPESRFELMPATEKIRSPVARNQGAVAGGVVVTEITQTTVTVEEEFESEHHHHVGAPPATIADITVVTESQQPVEREIVEQPKDDKPDGDFWGFLGKKGKSEQPAATTATVEVFDNTVIEREFSEDKAAVSAFVQVESIRRSIPSDYTPTNAASVAAQSGKLVRDSERRTTELTDGVEPDIELEEHYVAIASPRHGGGVLNGGEEWTVTPCSLAWNRLRLNRKNWKGARAGTASTGTNEVVLNDVSGSLKAREFLIVTGPSKDESLALLSCLAGYENAMEGNVTVNGREWNEKMNRYIAYVMREDLFYETLTVHEHLVIQAQLRMRRSHSDEMCLARVERVIEDMGLSSCRDKLIGGGVSLGGITRGERKLLAIATALLTNPSILLVEEPTNGLDTFSAEKIVAKLRWLAFEKGLTVTVTLHHPSSHFYGHFDVLYLVADASCVYDGKASDCVAYFSTIGYNCPEYMSPMDYFMLQMATGDRDTDDEGVARVEMLKREWTERNAAVYADNAARAAAASENSVVDDYDQKDRYRHMSCCGQLWLLWARHVRRLSRYGFVFWWHLLAALLIGVVFGLVYLQLDLNDQQGIQNFAGAFFYIVVVQMLFIAYRTFVFMPRETAIALRERQEYRGGWYQLLCWYFTKIVAELPALIILSIALFVPVFLLVGIGHGFKVYIYMQIAIVLAGWAAVGLAFLTLGVLQHVTLALIVYAVLLILFVAFGGLLINVTDIPDWLVWLHYISPVKYGYEALMKIFWKRVDSIDCDWTLEGCVALTGDGVLKYYSMESRSALGDSLILFGICFALFFVAFWFLLALSSKRVSGLQWRYDWSFKGPLGRRQQRIGNATVGEKHVATRSSMHPIVERKSPSAADGENYYVSVETPRVGGRGVCDAPGLTLGWSSLWLRATTDKKSKVAAETKHQQYLLSDASGSAKCGELVLITGPSDESNVALLESLIGLQKKLRGIVTLNGVATSPQKVAECAAYVTRDDLFYETLTVEEHLRFQAQLVVGKSTGGCGLCCGASAGDLETERVEMALDELELTSQRHVLIRYLSAADVKLVAVATSLLNNPSILLVEEPTCGMDFYSSQRVVLKLRQLARGGRTVVVTMTHPSSYLYALFDSLYVLADGAAVYHGKVREAVPYFASLGYQCPQYMSPVDFFIRQVSMRNNVGATANGQANLFTEAWSTRYSELCIAGDNEDQEVQGGEAGHRRRVGCCSQISLLFRRHILRLARYRAVFGWHAFWMIILGVIFGLIFLQLDLDDQQDIQNWAGAFFFIIVLQMLVIAYRTFVFLPREMAIAEREHRSGGYYMICWYLTKVFSELPAMLVLSVLLFLPAYLLIGIGHGFKLYFYMQLVVWLAGWSAAGMASLLLGLFRRVRVTLIVYMLLLILFVVFGGLLVNVDDVPDYLIWLHYISPVKYGYEALMKLFWGRIAFLACGESDGSGSGSATFATVGDDYSFSMSGSGSYEDDDCIAHSGDEVLSHYSMQTSRNARSDSIILLELTVLYFFIGYAFLSLRWRRCKTHQQRYSSHNNIDN